MYSRLLTRYNPAMKITIKHLEYNLHECVRTSHKFPTPVLVKKDAIGKSKIEVQDTVLAPLFKIGSMGLRKYCIPARSSGLEVVTPTLDAVWPFIYDSVNAILHEEGPDVDVHTCFITSKFNPDLVAIVSNFIEMDMPTENEIKQFPSLFARLG